MVSLAVSLSSCNSRFGKASANKEHLHLCIQMETTRAKQMHKSASQLQTETYHTYTDEHIKCGLNSLAHGFIINFTESYARTVDS